LHKQLNVIDVGVPACCALNLSDIPHMPHGVIWLNLSGNSLGAASVRPYGWGCRGVWAQQACAPTVGIIVGFGRSKRAPLRVGHKKGPNCRPFLYQQEI